VRGLLDSRGDLSESERDDLMGDIARDYNDYRDLYRGSTDAIIRRICRDLGVREPGAAKPAKVREALPVSNDDGTDLESLLHPTHRHGRDPP